MHRSLALVAVMALSAPALAESFEFVGPPADIGASATETVELAEVRAITGQVQAWDAASGVWKCVKVGDRIAADAMVRTGLRSDVTLALRGSEVKIGSISRLTASSALSPDPGVRSYLSLDHGDLDSRLARDSYRSFTVVAPQPTLGIQNIVNDGRPANGSLDRFTLPGGPRGTPYQGRGRDR